MDGSNLDLLDAPGILPPRLKDQDAAMRLAICNDIGEASYLASATAAYFLEQLRVMSLCGVQIEDPKVKQPSSSHSVFRITSKPTW